MAKDPAFLFYPGDYLRDTQILSERVQVAYDRIMCEHMRNTCITQAQLNFFTKRLTDDEKEELMFVLTEVDGGYQINWVAESISKRKEYSESRRKNRSSKPESKDTNTSQSHDKHMEIENEIENRSVNAVKSENEFEIMEYPAFSDFWDMYDKKRGDKEKVQKKWKQLTQKDKEAIMEYLPAYLLSTPDKQFRKDPLTFLNNKSWNDEIITATTQNGKQPRKLNFTMEQIDPTGILRDNFNPE